MQVSQVPSLGGIKISYQCLVPAHLWLGHLLWVCGWTGEGTGAALTLGWWQHMCHPCTWLPEG